MVKRGYNSLFEKMVIASIAEEATNLLASKGYNGTKAGAIVRARSGA